MFARECSSKNCYQITQILQLPQKYSQGVKIPKFSGEHTCRSPLGGLWVCQKNWHTAVTVHSQRSDPLPTFSYYLLSLCPCLSYQICSEHDPMTYSLQLPLCQSRSVMVEILQLLEKLIGFPVVYLELETSTPP